MKINLLNLCCTGLVTASSTIAVSAAPTGHGQPLDTKSVSLINISLKETTSPLAHHIGLSCTITNGSDIPIVIDGDSASLEVAKSSVQVAPLKDLVNIHKPPNHGLKLIARDTGSVLTAMVTVGALQTLKGIQEEYKPVMQRYGWEEERRLREIETFGKRLLYPGDSTTGNLYFAVSTLKNTSFKCMISSFYDQNNSTTLSKAIDER